jgi:hypothetical protein
MKKLLVLFSLLFTVSVFAQNTQPVGNFSIVDNSIQFIKVYSDSCGSIAVAEKELMMMLSKYKMKNLQLQSTLYMITGTLALDQPSTLTCNFTIEIKSGKYRVICYAISTGTGPINGEYTKKNGTIWSNSTKGLKKLDDRLSKIFDLATANEPKW